MSISYRMLPFSPISIKIKIFWYCSVKIQNIKFYKIKKFLWRSKRYN